MKRPVLIVIVVVMLFLGMIISYTLSAPPSATGGMATTSEKAH